MFAGIRSTSILMNKEPLQLCMNYKRSNLPSSHLAVRQNSLTARRVHVYFDNSPQVWLACVWSNNKIRVWHEGSIEKSIFLQSQSFPLREMSHHSKLIAFFHFCLQTRKWSKAVYFSNDNNLEVHFEKQNFKGTARQLYNKQHQLIVITWSRK